MFEQCLPEDLMQYGLIPEFIGRLPVTSAVHQLSREDLITILTEPRNAIVKQFQRFFGFDGIELVFSDDALKAVADKALERETGARGLRSIIEEVLLEVQFELPSRRDVKKCVVTKETIERGVKPTLVTEAPDEATTRRVRPSAPTTLTYDHGGRAEGVLIRRDAARGAQPRGRAGAPIPEGPQAGVAGAGVQSARPSRSAQVEAPTRPRHPFQAPNGRSNLHVDAYQTVHQGPGPLGRDMTRVATFREGGVRLGDLRLARADRDDLRGGRRARCS